MQYTLAVTSCNRHGLLQKTLDSFIKYADVLPVATVIVEDSDHPRPEWLFTNGRYAALGARGVWKSNGQRRGQIFTLDSLYDEVETPYVFHLEDDWEFTRGDFVARSFRILEKHKDISIVSVRGNDCNGHPIISESRCNMQMAGWQGGWGGYSFNPGLRRMSDLEIFGGSFGNFVGYGQHGCGHELDISRLALGRGYRIAVLDEKPHCKHIGAGVSRAIEQVPAQPRILLAVPATRHYDYANHTSGVKRETVGRVEAVRATWFKDAQRFPNVTARFFYGDSTRMRTWGDEVFLDCPDDYTNLPEKVRAICRYARAHDYDYLVKADDDTIIYIDRLLRSGFDQWDQMGWNNCVHNHPCGCYVTGMCYTLSRGAIALVADAPLLDPAKYLFSWAEDYSTGMTLRAAGIKGKGHPGWISGTAGHYVSFPLPRNTVAAHSVKPEDMLKWHKSTLLTACARL